MGKRLWRQEPLPHTAVRFESGLLAERRRVNRRATIPVVYERLRETGRIAALGLKRKPGQPFWDSDVAKWVEAAGLSLATHPDGALRKTLHRVVSRIVSAQQADGYLNTWFTTVDPKGRWKDLTGAHELYSAGHLMEAAVAHYRATGNRRFIDAMCRYADYIGSVFGRGRGKLRGYPGHQEIELALVKLFRATGRRRYLNLAKYFIDERGTRPNYFRRECERRGVDPSVHGDFSSHQAHAPVREQREAVGHAVRAMYMYCGMADVAAETGDRELLAACRRLWNSAVGRKMYITGGVGAVGWGEAFGRDYELPNASAYCETCAAIGLVFFAHRMLQIEADSRYADTMERALYNGVLSGLSRDGRKFFYVNPLASDGRHHRQDFFRVCCCPTNIVRLLAGLGSYVYSTAPGAVYVHLYAAGEARCELAGQNLTLRQRTDYPWDGKVRIEVGVREPTTFALMLRVPEWCRKHETAVNGRRLRAPVTQGYAKIDRAWRDGDVVELSMDMPVERIVSLPAVAENAGRVALQRGPIVFCLEQCDHRAGVRSIVLPDAAKLSARFDAKSPGGCVVIEGEALAPETPRRQRSLYRPASETKLSPVKLKAIPYFLWDNRKAGAMTVWLARR